MRSSDNIQEEEPLLQLGKLRPSRFIACLFVGLVVLLASGIAIYFAVRSDSESELNGNFYDIIIVGSGTAGSVLAHRLSSNPDIAVLLLEAGGGTTKCTGGQTMLTCYFDDACLDGAGAEYTQFDIPWFGGTRGISKYSWLPRFPQQVGRGLGGTGVINSMAWLRGKQSDFDRLQRDYGIDGWDWQTVKDFYKRSESYSGPFANNTDDHNTQGMVSVTDFPGNYDNSFLLQSAIAAGYRHVDLNGDDRAGFGFFPFNKRQGRRHSTAHAYLCPSLNRSNLHIRPFSEVTKVLFQNSSNDSSLLKAVGVEYLAAHAAPPPTGTPTATAFANIGIVVSAGWAGTPYLLMKSGAGPRADLEALGIPVVLDVPGLGKHAHEDIAFHVEFEYLNPSGPPREGAVCASALDEWMTEGTGWYAGVGVYDNTLEGGYIARESSGDLDIMLRRGSISGSMTITISPATIDPNANVTTAFTHHCNISLKQDLTGVEVVRCAEVAERDVEDAAYAIEVLRTIASNEPMASFSRETSPGPDVVSREELKEWVRTRFVPYNHVQGTARMGHPGDPYAVVDDTLRMIGVSNLWIADNSIYPTQVSQDAQACATLAGERAAVFIDEFIQNII